MNKMTLGWRLGVSFGALLLLIGVLGSIAVWRINLAAASARNLAAKRGPEVQVSSAVAAVAWDARFNIRSYSLSGDEENLRSGRRLLTSLKDQLKTAAALTEKFPDLVGLKAGHVEAGDKTAELEVLVDKMESEYKNADLLDQALDGAGRRFSETTQALRQSEQQRMNEEFDELESRAKLADAPPKAAGPVGNEPVPKPDIAAFKQRLEILSLIDDMIDAGNQLQLDDFKTSHLGDMDARSGILRQFVSLEKIMTHLTALLSRRENLAQMDVIQKAVADYKLAMEKDLKNQLAIRDNARDSFSAGRSVTSRATLVADSGSQAIGKEAMDVSKGLDLTGTILQVGLLVALLGGVLISWLCMQAITVPIREGVTALAATASEISATLSQLAANANETAAAVAETTTTVDEVRQTAQVAADKAKAVADSAQGAALAAEAGRKATDETVHGFNHIREHMCAIGESISHLNVQSQAVGDIVATVADLAEQSNLLAVNASIEAAKAGEQGKGFGVVAQEIRNLAEQSKDSTKQVRAILGDVQHAAGHAVMAVEQGGKGVAEGSKQADDAGQAIRVLAATMQDATRAALQIAASSQQQLVGMEQVGRAMESIRTATSQNADGARQLATAAHTLRDIGARLKALVDVDAAAMAAALGNGKRHASTDT